MAVFKQQRVVHFATPEKDVDDEKGRGGVKLRVKEKEKHTSTTTSSSDNDDGYSTISTRSDYSTSSSSNEDEDEANCTIYNDCLIVLEEDLGCAPTESLNTSTRKLCGAIDLDSFGESINESKTKIDTMIDDMEVNASVDINKIKGSIDESTNKIKTNIDGYMQRNLYGFYVPSLDEVDYISGLPLRAIEDEIGFPLFSNIHGSITNSLVTNGVGYTKGSGQEVTFDDHKELLIKSSNPPVTSNDDDNHNDGVDNDDNNDGGDEGDNGGTSPTDSPTKSVSSSSRKTNRGSMKTILSSSMRRLNKSDISTTTGNKSVAVVDNKTEEDNLTAGGRRLINESDITTRIIITRNVNVDAVANKIEDKDHHPKSGIDDNHGVSVSNDGATTSSDDVRKNDDDDVDVVVAGSNNNTTIKQKKKKSMKNVLKKLFRNLLLFRNSKTMTNGTNGTNDGSGGGDFHTAN